MSHERSISDPSREERLVRAIEQEDKNACSGWLHSATRDEAVHAVAALGKAERTTLLSLLDADQAADLLGILPDVQAIEALRDLEAGVAAEIVEQRPSDERADLITAFRDADAEAILQAMETEVAEETRRLAAYDEESAGGLMLTEYLVFSTQATVRDVLQDLGDHAERYQDYDIQYTYVSDSAGVLQGVVPVRRLLLAPRQSSLEELMISNPESVRDLASLVQLRSAFDAHDYLALPVVDDAGRLVGVVDRSAIEEVAIEEADDLYRQSQGIVGGEELRSMPLLIRSRRRLAWLSTNILLNILAASIIAMHQSTLEAVIALAVFLPIVSDMSGCSGNQAVAVSMRELTLGVTRPRDLGTVLLKESAMGILNGLALGLLVGGVAYLWQGNVYLSLVVAAALAANTLVAVLIGGSIPLLLKRIGVDPALASGPILTTITDMSGFLITLGLASAMLTRLLG